MPIGTNYNYRIRKISDSCLKKQRRIQNDKS